MTRSPPALLTLALATAVLASGCISSSQVQPASLAPALPSTSGAFHLPGGLPADPARVAGLVKALGGQYFLGAEAGEPTLGVTKDGAIFMSKLHFDATTTLPVSGVMRSKDQGRTWQDVTPMLPAGVAPNPPDSFDPYVYVDPATSRVFTDDLQALACSWLSWSDDLGQTWSTNPVACGIPGANDHQTLVAAKPRTVDTNGYPNVLYYCINQVADTGCATSLDGGQTFSPVSDVYAGLGSGNDPTFSDGCGGLSGHLAAAPDGTVFLPEAPCGVPQVAITRDDGASWTIYTINRTELSDGHDVSIAVDEAGAVYAFWINATGMPVLSVSRDGGMLWGPALQVAPPGVTAAFLPAIAAGAPGKVAFAYVGTAVADGYANKTSTPGGGPLTQGEQQDPALWANATWNAYLGTVTDARDAQPVIQTVTANDPGDPVARGVCGRTRCMNDNGTSGMFDFIDLTIDATGRPWASFVDMCTGPCSHDASANKTEAAGFVGTLREGSALRGAGGALPPLPAQPAVPAAPSGSALPALPAAGRAAAGRGA